MKKLSHHEISLLVESLVIKKRYDYAALYFNTCIMIGKTLEESEFKTALQLLVNKYADKQQYGFEFCVVDL
jgi:hypothetical protein